MKSNLESELEAEATARKSLEDKIAQAEQEKYDLQSKVAMLSTHIENQKYKLARMEDNEQYKQRIAELEGRVLELSALLEEVERLKINIGDLEKESKLW